MAKATTTRKAPAEKAHLIEKEPTNLQGHFADWIVDKTGLKLDEDTYAAFVQGVKMGDLLRIEYQASDENKARREAVSQAIADREAEREEARAAKVKEREEKLAAQEQARNERAEARATAKAERDAAKTANPPKAKPATAKPTAVAKPAKAATPKATATKPAAKATAAKPAVRRPARSKAAAEATF